MFILSDELKKFRLHAVDGIMGKCKDVLIQETTWTIRFFVVEIGPWLFGKRVLISPVAFGKADWPVAFGKADWKDMQIYTDLNCDQIRSAPNLDENKPVSRILEKRYHNHYDWPEYWTGGELWGGFRYPGELGGSGITKMDQNRFDIENESELEEEVEAKEIPPLRSIQEIIGYRVHAKDGEIGHIEGFMIDTNSWTLRYCIVDTRNWLLGKLVLISPHWLTNVDWFQKSAMFALNREEIQLSPKYDPAEPFTREDEIRLYDHYGRPFYWVS